MSPYAQVCEEKSLMPAFQTLALKAKKGRVESDMFPLSNCGITALEFLLYEIIYAFIRFLSQNIIRAVSGHSYIAIKTYLRLGNS